MHAKVYRFWMRGGQNITLAGSVNLTYAGHSHSNAGNFESSRRFIMLAERSQELVALKGFWNIVIHARIEAGFDVF